MAVELVSLSLDLSGPQLRGTMFLRNTDLEDEDDGDDIRQLEVQQVNVLPGYELVTPDGVVIPDGRGPVGREAHRLMRMLLMPTSEAAVREVAVRRVLSTGSLAVLDDAEAWRTHLVAFMRGEITRDQLGWLAENTNRLAASPAPVTEPSLDATIPQQWWDAVKARMRKHDLDSSASLVQAATMLGWPEEDVEDAVHADRLATILSDGETRVSRWQFEGDLDDRTPGTHQLIPGVDVILACLPWQARDGRTLGQWMTTLHRQLRIDGNAVSPRTWLRSRNPLADVIAALTSIR